MQNMFWKKKLSYVFRNNTQQIQEIYSQIVDTFRQ